MSALLAGYLVIAIFVALVAGALLSDDLDDNYAAIGALALVIGVVWPIGAFVMGTYVVCHAIGLLLAAINRKVHLSRMIQ